MKIFSIGVHVQLIWYPSNLGLIIPVTKFTKEFFFITRIRKYGLFNCFLTKLLFKIPNYIDLEVANNVISNLTTYHFARSKGEKKLYVKSKTPRVQPHHKTQRCESVTVTSYRCGNKVFKIWELHGTIKRYNNGANFSIKSKYWQCYRYGTSKNCMIN